MESFTTAVNGFWLLTFVVSSPVYVFAEVLAATQVSLQINGKVIRLAHQALET